MFKTIALATMALGALTVSASADGIKAGRLVCLSEGGTGMIFTSEKALSCTFSPVSGGPEEIYVGKIEKFGIDIGITGKSVMIWDVLAKSEAGYTPRALAGEYFGVGADASVAAGAGAKILGGGTDKAFMLQPVTVQAQEGVNVALGVEKMTLVPPAI
ncbi:MAG: DUF992 domain-containing protein [Allorhizobium sp.]